MDHSPNIYYPHQAKGCILLAQTPVAAFEILYVSESVRQDNHLVGRVYRGCVLGSYRIAFSTIWRALRGAFSYIISQHISQRRELGVRRHIFVLRNKYGIVITFSLIGRTYLII